MPIDLQLLTMELSLPDEVRGPPRLLIVDDDVVQQELLKRAAGRAGFEISLAASLCGFDHHHQWHRGGSPFGRAGIGPIAGN